MILFYISYAFAQFIAGLLRNSTGFGSTRIYSVHVTGHESNDINGRPSVTDVVTSQNVAKAQNTVVGLLLKLNHDVCNEKQSTKVESHIPLIQSLLDHFNIRYTDLAQGSKISDLTISTPKTGGNGNGSGFEYKKVFIDFEKVRIVSCIWIVKLAY
jgi:hypothetical protein